MTIEFGKSWYAFHLSILWWPKDYPPIVDVGNNCWLIEITIGRPMDNLQWCRKLAFWKPIELNGWVIEKTKDGYKTYFKK